MDDLPMKKKQEVLLAAAELAVEHEPAWMKYCTESPIEKLFALAAWARGCWAGDLQFSPGATKEILLHITRGTGMIFAAPQVQIGEYRVDFLFVAERYPPEPPIYVAVECDGHDFHDKTKEQAARDKSRDRDLLAHGVMVMRFTGSELWADACACADEVLALIKSELAECAHRTCEQMEREKGRFVQ